MATSTEQLIKDHLATLPEPVKKAIGSFDWTREVFDIGRKHSMHIDRIGELQTEVMLVVLGLISPRQFQDELLSRIEPNRETALEVSDEVNQKVFVRIRDFMKDYYDREEGKSSVVKSSAELTPEDELGSSEHSILNETGIALPGDAAYAQDFIVAKPAPQATSAISAGIDHTSVSLMSDEELDPEEVQEPVAPVAPTVKAEVRKSPVTVITDKDTPKNFLDPYREPLE